MGSEMCIRDRTSSDECVELILPFTRSDGTGSHQYVKTFYHYLMLKEPLLVLGTFLLLRDNILLLFL